MPEDFHLRRLYTPLPLPGEIVFEGGQHHYLKNVLRMEAGSRLRLFNPESGEFIATLSSVDKKRAVAMTGNRLRKPHTGSGQVILAIPPLERERMRWLVEKATELGMTALQPVVTARTEKHTLNHEKTLVHMIEAAEQCERLDIPALAPAVRLEALLAAPHTTLIAAIERRREGGEKLPGSGAIEKDVTRLVGPPGGFTDKEKAEISAARGVFCIDLGENILRSETAALALLTLVRQRGFSDAFL